MSTIDSLFVAVKEIHQFNPDSLTDRISFIEKQLTGADASGVQSFYPTFGLTSDLLKSAITIKQEFGQINVLIHAVAILLSLPHILEEDEVVQSLSLGAGNTTGRRFDLETNLRIAEFKFSKWQGGKDAMRKKTFFKDFFNLAEYESPKQKYLYVLNTKFPLSFLESEESLINVMNRNNNLLSEFQARYDDKFQKVKEYYEYRKSEVHLVGVSEIIPDFKNNQIGETNEH